MSLTGTQTFPTGIKAGSGIATATTFESRQRRQFLGTIGLATIAGRRCGRFSLGFLGLGRTCRFDGDQTGGTQQRKQEAEHGDLLTWPWRK
jgi:hypothetical protein